MRLAIMLIILSCVIGCGQSKKTKAPKKSESKKSTIDTVVDGVTGKTAVDAGKKAKAQIESISKKHNDDLNEVMGE